MNVGKNYDYIDSYGVGYKIRETSDLIKDLQSYSDSRNKYAIPVGEANFEPREVPIDPYLLGLLLGDGYLKQGVAISTKDKEILDYLYGSLDKGYTLKS